MSVYKKIQLARISLYDAGLKQSGTNKNNGTTYFELVDFTVDTQRIFNDVGLSSVFSMTIDNATLTIVDVETSEKIDFSCPVCFALLPKETEKSVKNLGATITYLRRYLWMSALEIPQKDVAELVKNHSKIQNPPELIDHVYIAECVQWFKNTPADYATLAGIIESLEPELLIETATACIREIKTIADLTGIADILRADKDSKAFQVFMQIRHLLSARKQALGG